MDVHVESRIPWCVWGGMEYRIQTRFDWRCSRPTPCCVVSEVLDKGSSTLHIIRDILLSLESPCELGRDMIITGTDGDYVLMVTIYSDGDCIGPHVTFCYWWPCGLWYLVLDTWFSGIFCDILKWCRTFDPMIFRLGSSMVFWIGAEPLILWYSDCSETMQPLFSGLYRCYSLLSWNFEPMVIALA